VRPARCDGRRTPYPRVRSVVALPFKSPTGSLRVGAIASERTGKRVKAAGCGWSLMTGLGLRERECANRPTRLAGFPGWVGGGRGSAAAVGVAVVSRNADPRADSEMFVSLVALSAAFVAPMRHAPALRSTVVMSEQPSAPAPPAAEAMNGWTYDPKAFCGGLPGNIAPLGDFDPAGFSKDKTASEIKRLREAEVMHCRVSMLAFIGYFVGEAVAPFTGSSFLAPTAITGPANTHLSQQNIFAFTILTIAIGVGELYRALVGWVPPTESLFTLRCAASAMIPSRGWGASAPRPLPCARDSRGLQRELLPGRDRLRPSWPQALQPGRVQVHAGARALQRPPRHDRRGGPLRAGARQR